MKTSKLFTIDVEIVQKLQQEDNASALVERLLKEYFTFTGDGKKKSPNSEGERVEQNEERSPENY